MEEILQLYIPALAPAIASIVAALTLFYRIVSFIKTAANDFSKKTTTEINNSLTETKELAEMQSKEIQELIDTNESLKEQYKQIQADLNECVRLNAELMAKLNQRGV